MKKESVTISYLLSNTPVEIINRATEHEPILVRHSGNRWVYKVNGKVVRITIINMPQQLTKPSMLRKIKNRHVLASCSCRFWKWNGPDFNAVDQGYSERTFSDLSRPVVRDPTGKYLICKHVYTSLKDLIENFTVD